MKSKRCFRQISMKLEFYRQRRCEDKNTKNQIVWTGASLPLGFTRLMTISGLINGMDLLVNQNITFVLSQKENCVFTDQNVAFLRTDLYLYNTPTRGCIKMPHISKDFCSFLHCYGDFLRHWLTKRPNSCWHQCHEIANCIGSFDSNKNVVSQYYRQNMQPKLTSTIHTSTRRRDVQVHDKWTRLPPEGARDGTVDRTTRLLLCSRAFATPSKMAPE